MRIVVTAVDSEAGYVLTCLEESRCESNGELLNCVSGQLCNLCEAVWAIRRSTCGIQCSGIKNARSGANKSRITTALADHSGRSKVAVQKMTVIIATALPQQWSTGTVMLPFTQSKHDHLLVQFCLEGAHVDLFLVAVCKELLGFGTQNRRRCRSRQRNSSNLPPPISETSSHCGRYICHELSFLSRLEEVDVLTQSRLYNNGPDDVATNTAML